MFTLEKFAYTEKQKKKKKIIHKPTILGRTTINILLCILLDFSRYRNRFWKVYTQVSGWEHIQAWVCTKAHTRF